MNHLSRLVLLATVSCISTLGLAAETAAASATVPGFRIQTEMEMKQDTKSVKANNEALIPERSSWVTLTGVNQGVQVLAKVGAATKETVRVDYIVLDTTASPNGVISTPSMIVRYGEPAHMEASRTIDGKVEKLSLSMTAKRETIPAESIKR